MSEVKSRNQYYATISVGIVSFAHGTVKGWTSPALPKLNSESTPLTSGPLSGEQMSWLGSIGAVGIICGSFLFGFVTSILGSKRASHSLAILSIAFWLLIYFGNDFYYILCANFFGGMMLGGIHISVILFISEIANDNIRGQLVALNHFCSNIGLLAGYILGTTLDYKLVPIISVIVPIAFVIIFSKFPNTPQYFLERGRIQEAELSLKYYKGYEGSTDLIHEEFERLKIIANMRKIEIRARAADICNRNGMKGLGIGFALVIFGQLTANIVLTVYAVPIFQQTGTTFDPYLAAIIMAATKILGSLLSTFFADILGRKYLNVISLFGSAVGLFAISIYQYLELNDYDLSAYQCVPVISLSFVIFISSVGIMSGLIFLCSIEHLEQKIRTFGLTLIGVALSVVAFITLKTFPFLIELIDLYGVFWIYGGGCIVGVFFVCFVLKETSGRSLSDIEFDEDKVALIPSRIVEQINYQSINNQ